MTATCPAAASSATRRQPGAVALALAAGGIHVDPRVERKDQRQQRLWRAECGQGFKSVVAAAAEDAQDEAAKPPPPLAEPLWRQRRGADSVTRRSSSKEQEEQELCRRVCESGSSAREAVDALEELLALRRHGPRVDNHLFYRALKRCTAGRDLAQGRRVHALAVRGGYQGDAFLATHLVGMYAAQARVEECVAVFAAVPAPDKHLWAAVIFACARHGRPDHAVRLFRQMTAAAGGAGARPDARVYVAVLKACAAAGDLAAGREVHAHLVAAGDAAAVRDAYVQTGVLVMYARCGSLREARAVFDALERKDVVTWNAMMAACAQQGAGGAALALYTDMVAAEAAQPDSHTFVCLLQACAAVGADALPDGRRLHADLAARGLHRHPLVGSSLVNMYAKCGTVRAARAAFDAVPPPHRDAVTWTAMIGGYVQQGQSRAALELYAAMPPRLQDEPDACTLVCLLQACAAESDLALGTRLHAIALRRGLLHPRSDGALGVALVHMYAKCGALLHAQRAFDALPPAPPPPVEAWTALMGAYARQGDAAAVLALLDRMAGAGARPTAVTLLHALTACAHAGEVDRGRALFAAMAARYGVPPALEHYTCVTDMLARAGRLPEALHLAKTMPGPPAPAAWHAVLGACQKWRAVEVAEQAFQVALRLDPADDAAYVLMANVYAEACLHAEAERVQGDRLRAGAWKRPGRAWLPPDDDGVRDGGGVTVLMLVSLSLSVSLSRSLG